MARPATSVPVPGLLRQLARELETLRHMTAVLETAVDALAAREGGTLDPPAMQDLQLFDIIGQHLAALSCFAERAAGLASSGWMLDGREATAGLALASLARRLAAAEDAPPPTPPGETEFFG